MNSIILYFIQVTTVFSVLYVLYRLFLSKLTFHKVNRVILLSIIPISTILPFSNSLFPSFSSEIINISLFESETFNVLSSKTASNTTKPMNAMGFKPLQVAEPHAVNSSVTYINLLMIAYSLVLSIYLIRFFITARRLFILKKKSLILNEKDYKLLISDVSEIFSFFKWIFIPTHFYKNFNPQILEHEKAHIKLNHSWDVIITELFTAVFWFNPLVYFYRKSLKAVHEFQADETVLKKGVKVSEYMQLLMETIEIQKPTILYNYFNQPILKKRVTMMTKPKSNRLSKLTYIIILPVCSLLILAFHKPIDTENTISNIVKASASKHMSPSLFPIPNASKEAVLSEFGEKRKHPKSKKIFMHGGIDIRSNLGNPIIATADGFIKKASLEGDWGNLIIIKHTDGYETWYAHLDKFNIKKDQKVKKGTIIGFVGKTGLTKKPHLHYEIRQNGKRLNPLHFIKK